MIHLVAILMASLVPWSFADDPTEATEVAIDAPLDFEARILEVVKDVVPVTVGVRVGGRNGSGVIVSADGLVLTAGHVSEEPHLDCTITLWDGRKLRAKTLGVNSRRDSGMVRIVEKTEEALSFVPLGEPVPLEPGDWCLATGHPGGYREGREPVLRIGRILAPEKRMEGARFVHTDTPLIGGDSGGPLWDLDGNLIGIHSRIEQDVASNYHVPIATFRQGWERLLRGDQWTRSDAKLGLSGVRDHERGARVVDVSAQRPAAKAGIVGGDIITTFNGEEVRGAYGLKLLLGDCEIGNEVILGVLRDGVHHSMKVTLAGPWVPKKPSDGGGDEKVSDKASDRDSEKASDKSEDK